MAHVRQFRFDSPEQQIAKKALPYILWAGLFDKRDSDNLKQHSGLIGIDLDDLSPKEIKAAMHKAMDDDHVAIAYRSTRLNGVWLIFRIPPVDSADAHTQIFQQVAAHVRTVYGHEPDRHCSDVSRASFVSWDSMILIKGDAKVFPVDLHARPVRQERAQPKQRKRLLKHSAPLLPKTSGSKFNLKEFGAFHFGMHCAPYRRKAESACYYTHRPLFRLGKHIAALICKRALSKTDAKRLMNEAFAGWMAGIERAQRDVRGDFQEYRKELGQIVRSSLRRPGIAKAAATWTRWLTHAQFPTDGEPEARLMFAIKKHCHTTRSRAFYLCCRDAMELMGVRSTRTANKLLHDLLRRKILCRSRDGKHAAFRFRRRDAQWYYYAMP